MNHLPAQFRLTYNTVLNLTATLTQDQIETYFQKSFAAYSYQLSSKHLHTELVQIQQQLEGAQHHLCEAVGTFVCPLKHHPKRKELERLKRTYKALGPRKQTRVYGREMARKIKAWDKLLSLSPKSCQSAEQDNCKDHSKTYLAIQQRRKELQTALADLPEENAFLMEFEYKKTHLRQLGYLREDELLPRGTCASRIYVQELLVTELIYSDIFTQIDDDQLNALLSSIDFEARKNDMFQRAGVFETAPVKAICEYIQSICGEDAVKYDPRVAGITYAWSQGQTFVEVQALCNLDEGDIISVFRRTIDLLRQMREAISDSLLRTRLKACMVKLDRDEAAIMEL